MTIEQAPCFGKLYDKTDNDCKACKVAESCEKKFNTPAPAMEVAGAATTPDPVATPDPALENEAQAVAEATEEVKATTEPKKKAADKPVKAKTKVSNAVKIAAFKKNDKGKMDMVDVKTKDADLVIGAGDILKIVNPRSKYNGEQGKMTSYSPKYNEIGIRFDKRSGLHKPDHVEIVTKAADVPPPAPAATA